MLNHEADTPWLHKPVRSLWLLNLYGIQTPTVTSYPIGDRFISSLGTDYIYLNDKESAYCRGNLKGAVLDRALIVVACGNELVLLTEDGDVVERIGSAYGMPSPVDALGRCNKVLCLQSQNEVYLINIDQLSWQVLDPTSQIQLEKSMAGTLPDADRQGLLRQHMGDGISWERVLLDLHSGRLFGLGPWLMDIVAVFLILLAISGVSMWYGGYRRRRIRK